MESKGWTHFSDEEIHTAGVFALVIMTGASSNPLLKGEEVIRQMSAHDYNIVLNNCQDFANKLARCLTNPHGTDRCTVF